MTEYKGNRNNKGITDQECLGFIDTKKKKREREEAEEAEECKSISEQRTTDTWK